MAMRMRMVMRMMQILIVNRIMWNQVQKWKVDLIQQNHRGTRTNILTEGRDSQDAVIVYREIFQLALPCSVPKWKKLGSQPEALSDNWFHGTADLWTAHRHCFITVLNKGGAVQKSPCILCTQMHSFASSCHLDGILPPVRSSLMRSCIFFARSAWKGALCICIFYLVFCLYLTNTQWRGSAYSLAR